MKHFMTMCMVFGLLAAFPAAGYTMETIVPEDRSMKVRTQPGDTLWDIVYRFTDLEGVDNREAVMQAVIGLNDLGRFQSNGQHLLPTGTEIIIPSKFLKGEYEAAIKRLNELGENRWRGRDMKNAGSQEEAGKSAGQAEEVSNKQAHPLAASWLQGASRYWPPVLLTLGVLLSVFGGFRLWRKRALAKGSDLTDPTPPGEPNSVAQMARRKKTTPTPAEKRGNVPTFTSRNQGTATG